MNKNLFKTYLLYFIATVAFVGIRIISELGAFSWISDAFIKSGVASIVIQCIAMFLIPFGLYMLFFKTKFKEVFKQINFNKISMKSIIICIIMGALAFLLNLAVASIFSTLLSFFGYEAPTTTDPSKIVIYDTFVKFLFAVLFVAVLPGVFEELLHRGILMRKMGKEIGYKRAIIFSSLLFGLMHLNVGQFFYASILGLLIGFVACISDSVIPAIILHFMNNFLNVYFSYAKNANLPGGDFYTRIANLYKNNSPIFTFIFSLMFLSLIVFGIFYLMLILFRETRMKKLQSAFNNVQKEITGKETEGASEGELVENFESYILPHLSKENYSVDFLLPVSAGDDKKPSLATNIFLIASICLGVLITIFTFIWGIV